MLHQYVDGYEKNDFIKFPWKIGIKLSKEHAIGNSEKLLKYRLHDKNIFRFQSGSA